jgi:hypothetical protein
MLLEMMIPCISVELAFALWSVATRCENAYYPRSLHADICSQIQTYSLLALTRWPSISVRNSGTRMHQSIVYIIPPSPPFS